MATIKTEFYRFNGSAWDVLYLKTTMDMVDGLITALSGKAASSHTLESHSNVVITSPSANQVLKYDGTNWVNSSDSNSNNYLSGVSGSGNGTVTFTRHGLSILTLELAHTHDDRYLASDGTAVNSSKLGGQSVSYFQAASNSWNKANLKFSVVGTTLTITST